MAVGYTRQYVVFFFQAEDGIRDLVRSRGLGDVYKRQVHDALKEFGIKPDIKWVNDLLVNEKKISGILAETVSYTHLTLPTIYSV